MESPLLKKYKGEGREQEFVWRSPGSSFVSFGKGLGIHGAFTGESRGAEAVTPGSRPKGSEYEHSAGKVSQATSGQFSDEMTAAVDGCRTGVRARQSSPSPCSRGNRSYLLGEDELTVGEGGLKKGLRGVQGRVEIEEVSGLVGSRFPAAFPLLDPC